MMRIKKIITAVSLAGIMLTAAIIVSAENEGPVTAPPTPPNPNVLQKAPPAASGIPPAPVQHPVKTRTAAPKRTIRNRWESLSPSEQQELLENYEIWKTMPPERRERLKKAYRIFNSLPPAKRQELRDKYKQVKDLPPEERARVMSRMSRWRKLTPQQKQAYRDGIAKFNALPPEKKEEIRAQLRALKGLPPQEQAKRREEIRLELARQGVVIPRKEPVEQNAPPIQPE